MIQRNERLSRTMKGGELLPAEEAVAEKPAEAESESEPKPEAADPDAAAKEKEEAAAAAKALNTEDLLKSLDQQLVDWNQKLVSENKNLHQVKAAALFYLQEASLVKCRALAASPVKFGQTEQDGFFHL